jgi:hypothetical protein
MMPLFRVALLTALLCAIPATAQEGKATRLTQAEAENVVRAFIFAENPRMNPEATFPLKELTTGAVWRRLGVQVFQVTEGVRQHETFVVKRQRVFPIGKGFGGYGVNSLCVADLNGDGRPELVYSFSWGSGVHRSQVGVFDALAKTPKEYVAPVACFGRDDLTLKAADDRTVTVSSGKTEVGRVTLAGEEGKRRVEIRLDDKLPADVRRLFR